MHGATPGKEDSFTRVENWRKAESGRHCGAAVAYYLLRGGKSYEFTEHFVTAASIVAGEQHETICEIRGLVKRVADELEKSSDFEIRTTLVGVAGSETTKRLSDWLNLAAKPVCRSYSMNQHDPKRSNSL